MKSNRKLWFAVGMSVSFFVSFTVFYAIQYMSTDNYLQGCGIVAGILFVYLGANIGAGFAKKPEVKE